MPHADRLRLRLATEDPESGEVRWDVEVFDRRAETVARYEFACVRVPGVQLQNRNFDRPISTKKSNHLARNGPAFLCKPSVAVETGSR